MIRCLIFTIACFTLFSCGRKMAIQPFEGVPQTHVEEIQRALSTYYSCEVEVLPTMKIPQEAFVNIKTPRYRADYLIQFLKEQKPSDYRYIIGITHNDISTTKYEDWDNKVIKEPKARYKDFGIFGLGYRPGPSCIVSSFRLGDGEQQKTRLIKIACHEIGHNMGLKHCSNKACFMRDAAEKLSTIDNVSLDLCAECKRNIGI